MEREENKKEEKQVEHCGFCGYASLFNCEACSESLCYVCCRIVFHRGLRFIYCCNDLDEKCYSYLVS